MINKRQLLLYAGLILAFISTPTHALLIGVAGPNSSAGTAASIIAAPAHALDDIVFNTGMEGFNEAQGVTTSVAHTVDGGVIAAGTTVDSHMIFLNSQGTAALSHFDVRWTFDGLILGVMSDSSGTLEAASTFELGNPGTNYTVTFPGSGPAAPFPARGLENLLGPSGPFPNDGYTVSGNSITVGMSVTEPGDWIRVITASVPEPSIVLLLSSGLILLGFARRRV